MEGVLGELPKSGQEIQGVVEGDVIKITKVLLQRTREALKMFNVNF